MHKKITPVLLLVIYCVLQAPRALCQPINDNAAAAIKLQLGAGCGTMYTNVGATQAANEPLASCSDDPMNPIYTGQHIVWFKFTAPLSGGVRISTDNGSGTLYDTQIALYDAADSSQYSTFQILGCDDDNGSSNGVASIFYATGLTGGKTYYVLVDGWRPSDIGTFCLTIDEISSAMLSTTNTCTSSYPAAWGGSSAWPINPVYKGWVSLVDNSGRIVVNIRNSGGGLANSYTCGQNVNPFTSALRQLPSGKYYLDRNYYVNNKNTTAYKDLEIQLFFLNTEFDRLNTAAGGNVKLTDLFVLKQAGTCSKNYSTTAQGIELPHVGCPPEYQKLVGKTATVSWVTAITDMPPPGVSNFFLYPNVIPQKRDTICAGDAITLRGSQVGTFAWDVVPGGSPVSTLNCSSCVNPVATPDKTTQYIQVFTSSLYCSDTSTVIVVPTTGSSSIDTTICANDSIQLHLDVDMSSGVKPDIKWSPAYYLSSDTSIAPFCKPLSSILYYVTIRFLNKCTTVDTVRVTVDNMPRTMATDTTICKNDTVQLHAPVDPTATLNSILWEPSSNLSSNTVKDPYCALSSSMQYLVTMNYGNKCKTIDTFRVHVSDLSKPQVTDTAICQYTMAPVIYIGADSLTWYTSVNDMTGMPSQPDIATSNPGRDTLFVSNRCGEAPVYIQIVTKPAVAINDTSVCSGTPVQLNAPTASDVNYKWSTDDNTCCIVIDAPGTYTVKASNMCGDAFDSITIFDPCGVCLWAPSAFTPNGDGKNDVFHVKNGCGSGNYHIIIVNRYGEKVYESSDITQGWDGTFNGEPVDVATYYYWVTYTPYAASTNETTMKSDVTVIR